MKKQLNEKNLKRDCKREKGITLIVLVVIIVVLLIVTGVSISMLTGNSSILRQAVKAKEQTKNASSREKIALLINEYQIYRNKSFEDFFSEKKNFKEIDDVKTISSDCVLVTIDDEKYFANQNGNIGEYKNSLQEAFDNGLIQMGQEVNYSIENGKNNYTKENDDGNYFMIKKEKTGYTEDQEFNVSDYIGKWRVLYDGSEGYGIQIISTSNVLEDKILYLKGLTGHENIIEILNNVAGHFINSKYVVSARCLYSNPTDNEETVGTNELYNYDITSKYNILVKESYGDYKVVYSKMLDLFNNNFLDFNVDIWGGRHTSSDANYTYWGASTWSKGGYPNTRGLGYIRYENKFQYTSVPGAGCVAILRLNPSAKVKITTESDNTIINLMD